MKRVVFIGIIGALILSLGLSIISNYEHILSSYTLTSLEMVDLIGADNERRNNLLNYLGCGASLAGVGLSAAAVATPKALIAIWGLRVSLVSAQISCGGLLF
jgi:hypothetical protein